VLSLLVRGEGLGVLPRRRGLLPLLVPPPPLPGGRGRWSSGVVGVVGGVLRVGGRLSLGGLPVLLQGDCESGTAQVQCVVLLGPSGGAGGR